MKVVSLLEILAAMTPDGRRRLLRLLRRVAERMPAVSPETYPFWCLVLAFVLLCVVAEKYL